MKKIICKVMILGSLLAIGSCENDDRDSNNDIEIITPNDDTTENSRLKVPQRRIA